MLNDTVVIPLAAALSDTGNSKEVTPLFPSFLVRFSMLIEGTKTAPLFLLQAAKKKQNHI
jgi:hypothetical protein